MTVSQIKAARRKIKQRYAKGSSRSVHEAIARERAQAERLARIKK